MTQFGFRLSDGSYFARSDFECVGIICYLQASGAWDGVWPQQLSPSSTDGPIFVQQFLIFAQKNVNSWFQFLAPNLVPISGAWLPEIIGN